MRWLTLPLLGLLACSDPTDHEAVTTGLGSSPAASSASATSSASSAVVPSSPRNVDAFLRSPGAPTFVAGTLGAPAIDRAVRVQIGLVSLLFKGATEIDDVAVSTGGWPAKPIVYGGPHVNAAVAGLRLPFEIGPGRLAIGEHVLEGDEYRIITVLPPTAEHPELLLYAGTATPGIVEINSVPHGPDAIVVADRFGPLLTGAWREEGGALVPALTRRSRPAWRTIERDAGGVASRIHFPEKLPPASDEAARVEAILRGIATSVKALRISSGPPIDVYVYPDVRSQVSFTGRDWNGQAVLESRALHVTQASPEATERLLAHEATHVLAFQSWGSSGVTVLGEGLAVWVSGSYGGKRLDAWRTELAKSPRPSASELVARGRAVPEATLYPLGGLLFGALQRELGEGKVRVHLFTATPATWGDACRAAGTTAEAVDAMLEAALREDGRPRPPR